MHVEGWIDHMMLLSAGTVSIQGITVRLRAVDRN